MKDDSPTDAARRIIAFNAMNGNADNASIDEVAVARAYLRAVAAGDVLYDALCRLVGHDIPRSTIDRMVDSAAGAIEQRVVGELGLPDWPPARRLAEKALMAALERALLELEDAS